MSTSELRFLVEALSKKPFKRSYSVVTLHDHLPYRELLRLLYEVAYFVSDEHAVTSSTAQLSEFLVSRLGYPISPSISETGLSVLLDSGTDKMLVLKIMHFLLSNMDALRRKSYVSRFCTPFNNIPSDFLHDEAIQELLGQLRGKQQQFSATFSVAQNLNEYSVHSNSLKRDIQQMEEEKTLVLGKIQRLQKKISEIPNYEKWVMAARELRLEQQREENLENQASDLKVQLSTSSEVLVQARSRISSLTFSYPTASPDKILQEFSEKLAFSKKCLRTMPKQIAKKQLSLNSIQAILTETNYSNAEIVKMEQELDCIHEEITLLESDRKKADESDNLFLFRQQAKMVSSRYTLLVREYEVVLKKVKNFRIEDSKTKTADLKTTEKLTTEKFKLYVTELRAKSQAYKARKQDLLAFASEEAILVRTCETLDKINKQQQRKLQAVEQRYGISGYTETKEKLEKISEKKGKIENVKEEEMHTLSDLVKILLSTIEAKKVTLAPLVTEIKQLRTILNEKEDRFTSLKKDYDRAVTGVETTVAELLSDCSKLSQVIEAEIQEHKVLEENAQKLEEKMQMVLLEAKAQAGDNTACEEIQKKCGHRAWREYYSRKIHEHEASLVQAKKELSALESRAAGIESQRSQFSAIEKLVNLRQMYDLIKRNEFTHGNTGPLERKTQEYLSAGEQRLVIS